MGGGGGRQESRHTCRKMQTRLGVGGGGKMKAVTRPTIQNTKSLLPMNNIEIFLTTA